jgi:lysophospholipase L1-like esterase
LGTNDSSSTGDKKVPIPRYTENLRTLVSVAQTHSIKVIVVGPAPHDEVSRAADGDTERAHTTMRNLEYSNAAELVAKEFKLPFVNLWKPFLEAVGWKEGEPIPGKLGDGSDKTLKGLLTDGVHFTGEGYKIFYRGVMNAIKTGYPEYVSENLPQLLPSIQDLYVDDYHEINPGMFRDYLDEDE